MSDLQNLTPANTYKGLLQVGDYTNGVDSTVKAVLDGEGTASALAIGTTKVGIGTTSPTQELDVNGDIVSTTLTTSGAVTAGSVSTSGAVTGGSLDVNGNVVADEYALDQTGTSSSAVAIHAPATNELAIRTNSTEAMRIDSEGRVGIGTTNPSKRLEVQLTDDTAYTEGVSSNSLKLRNLSQSADSYSGVELTAGQISGGESNIARIYAIRESNLNTATSLAFTTRESNQTVSEAMRIDSSGNVGIGTDSPSAPLEVSSTTGGVIMPRMNTTQMNAISNPTDGEMIYNTTEDKFYGRANGAWTALH
jgi:hypothetical protein